MASHAVAQNPDPASLLESARLRPSQTELGHIYGSSLLAAAVGATPVIWQASKNYVRTTEDIADLRPETQLVRAIALGSAYVTMKSLSGEKQMMNDWMKVIENCVVVRLQGLCLNQAIAAANKMS